MHGLLEAARGRELIDFIESLCAERGIGAGWVRAFGTLAEVEVAAAGGIVELEDAVLVGFDASVALVGDRPTVRAFAIVTAAPGGAPVTVSGELRRARCDEVEIAVFAMDGIAASRHAAPDGSATLTVEPAVASGDGDLAAGAPARKRSKSAHHTAGSEPAQVGTEKEPKAVSRPDEAAGSAPARKRPSPPQSPVKQPAAKQASAKAGGKDWTAVAAASARVAAGDWDDDENDVDVDELERGDTLLHPQLAACTIVAVINDDAVKVRLPNGSVRKLVMRGFRLLREEDGVFRVERKK